MSSMIYVVKNILVQYLYAYGLDGPGIESR